MTVLRTVSAHRRRMTTVALAGTLAITTVGADVASNAGRADARPAADATVAARASTVASTAASPVSVPASTPFELDRVPVTVEPDPPAAFAPGVPGASGPGTGGSVRDVAAATLADLPASDGVTLLFDHPQLAGHLGGVFMGSPGYLLVNARRLAGDPAKTRDVVRHEIAHIYQARLATTLGFETVDARMEDLFGPGGLERSADCVALALGATWTNYTTDCAAPEKVAAVDALLAGRMP